MRPVRRAALALAAAAPLALSPARAEEPVPASAPPAGQAPPAAADGEAKAGAGPDSSGIVPPANGAAKDFFAPAASKGPAAGTPAWSSPAGGHDGDGPVEGVRTGRCGG